MSEHKPLKVFASNRKANFKFKLLSKYEAGIQLLGSEVKSIREGNVDAKIEIIVYESLTCSHCANFHKNVYPDLKKEFIDTNLIKIEFRSFPLDMAALNASKIAHCKNDGDSKILHFLFEKQSEWMGKASTVKEINKNLQKYVKKT